MEVFIYDPSNNIYLRSLFVTADEKHKLSPNFTETPVINEEPDKLRVYDQKNDNWYYISKCCYKIDEKGFILAKYQNPLPLDILSDDLVDHPLAENLKNPRWNGCAWEDKPIPENLFIPVFDLESSEWIESATKETIRDRIDARTSQLITKWCDHQTKNEEYYINRGIEDRTDPEYLTYKEAKARIILEQRQKKIEAGVY